MKNPFSKFNKLFIPRRMGNKAILPMDFVKQVQRSGHFPSLRTVIAECKKIENDRKIPFSLGYNFILIPGYRDFIGKIREVVTSYEYEEMEAIMQMLSYSSGEINRSTILWLAFIITLCFLVISLIFIALGFGNLKLTVFIFSLFLLSFAFHLVTYIKINEEIGFVKTFEELEQSMTKCNENFEKYFQKVIAFENQIDEIRLNAELNEGTKRSELEIRRNLLALNYEILDFEFEKRQEYTEKEEQLKDGIQRLKNNTENKRLREELEARGLTGKDQKIMQFMVSMKEILVEQAKAVTTDINEKRQLLTKIQMIASAESLIEQYGMEGLGKMDFQGLMENLMGTGELKTGRTVNTTATPVEDEEERDIRNDWVA